MGHLTFPPSHATIPFHRGLRPPRLVTLWQLVSGMPLLLRSIRLLLLVSEESETVFHCALCLVGFAGWHEWYGRIEGVVGLLLVIRFACRPRGTVLELKKKIKLEMENELQDEKEIGNV